MELEKRARKEKENNENYGAKRSGRRASGSTNTKRQIETSPTRRRGKEWQKERKGSSKSRRQSTVSSRSCCGCR